MAVTCHLATTRQSPPARAGTGRKVLPSSRQTRGTEDRRWRTSGAGEGARAGAGEGGEGGEAEGWGGGAGGGARGSGRRREGGGEQQPGEAERGEGSGGLAAGQDRGHRQGSRHDQDQPGAGQVPGD